MDRQGTANLTELNRKPCRLPALPAFGPNWPSRCSGTTRPAPTGPICATVTTSASIAADRGSLTFGWLEHDRAIPDIEQGHLGRPRAAAGELAFRRGRRHRRQCPVLLVTEPRLSNARSASDEASELGRAGAVLSSDSRRVGTLWNQPPCARASSTTGGATNAEADAAFNARFELAVGLSPTTAHSPIAAGSHADQHIALWREPTSGDRRPQRCAESLHRHDRRRSVWPRRCDHSARPRLALGDLHHSGTDRATRASAHQQFRRHLAAGAWILSRAGKLQDATGTTTSTPSPRTRPS